MGEGLEAGVSEDKELDGQLRHALLFLLRYARAGRRTDASHLDPLVEELSAGLAHVLDRWGVVHLRVGVAALYRGEHVVLEFSPREDVVFFRLFQHGVRQLSFHPGLSSSELRSFLDVLTADFSGLEHAEDDVTTLLASADLPHVQFVVVETFSEGEGDVDPGGRAGDVAAIMAAALRETLSQEATGEGLNNIRFWEADVKFLEEANLAELVAAMPESRAASATSGFTDDAEILDFGRELSESLARCTPWLPWSGLSILVLCDDDEDAARLAGIIAAQIHSDIRKWGLGDCDQLAVLLGWIREHAAAPQADVLARELFSQEMTAWLISAIGDAAVDGAVVVHALTLLPIDRVAATLREVCELTPGPARKAAIEALLGHGQTDLTGAADLFARVEGETALALVDSVAGIEATDEAQLFYRSAFGHAEPAVRMRSLAWFVHHADTDAFPIISRAMRDPSPEVRLAGMHSLITERRRKCKGPLRTWYTHESFDELPFEEKRAGALLFARAVGSAAAPVLQKAVAKTGGLLNRKKVEESRAAAVAGLGFLADPDSVPLVQRLAKGKGVLAEEAAHVVECFRTGAPAYPDPIEELKARTEQRGILGLLTKTAARPTGASADFMPTMIGPAEVDAVGEPEVVRVDIDPESMPAVAPVAMSDRPTAPPATPMSERPTKPPALEGTEQRPTARPRREATDAAVSELLTTFAFDDLPPMPPIEGLAPEIDTAAGVWSDEVPVSGGAEEPDDG